MAKRAGAFSGQFAPETLDRFKDVCKKHGKQYTKVLERLAEVYLFTDGAILSEPTSTTSETSEDTVTTGDLKEIQIQIDEIKKELNCSGLEAKIKRLEEKERNGYENYESQLSDIFNRLMKLEKPKKSK